MLPLPQFINARHSSIDRCTSVEASGRKKPAAYEGQQRIPAANKNSPLLEQTDLFQRKKTVSEEPPLLNVLSIQPFLQNRLIKKQAINRRKRNNKALKQPSIISYWDNRSPIAVFENNARVLQQSLAKYPSTTSVHLPENLKTYLSQHDKKHAFLSSDFWESHIEYWLSLNSEKRKNTLDQRMMSFLIPASDPRKKLHGQFGVIAARDIPPLSIIAPYGGMYCVGNDLHSERNRHGANIGRYSVDCSMHGMQINLFGYAHGNITICINANTTYVESDPYYKDNCCFVIVVYRNWPYVLITSTAPIKQGSELLIDYGRHYWK
ncbi:SET domain-containing protein-lysine N-methyltransferase [uncultured Endozoicomonas sp.]|uniref:SET domain-containing protein-lysine N-methyltransferase n=1 Tax=uncultured Endozoicomonas sp. TaxID=432652 RepID=UPI0026287DF1|nr:SET domain-containing protein-lysine N-methyltransferase [uncultured Endozoicomonas sp.]